MDSRWGLALGALGVVGLGAAAAGLALWWGERQSRQVAENWAQRGRPDKPEATITERPDAEERAMAHIREQGVDRLTKRLKKERPDIPEDRLREHAHDLISKVESYGRGRGF